MALNTVRNIYAHKIENHARGLAEIVELSRQPQSLLQRLVRVPLEIFPEASAKQYKFLTAIAAMSFLWQLEFRAQPPWGSLIGRMLDDAEKSSGQETEQPT